MESSEATKLCECPTHGQYQSKLIHIRGRVVSQTPCPQCTQAREALAARAQDTAKALLVASAIQHCNIPARFQESTLDNFECSNAQQRKAVKLCHAYLQKFSDMAELGAGMLLLGHPGTGKTHLGCAIVAELTRRGIASLYKPMLEFMDECKLAWARGDSERGVLRKHVEPHLLMLDEVGMQFDTNAERVMLYRLVNERYVVHAPTIVASNLALPDLTEFAGERVVDRLLDSGAPVIVCDWESYRRRDRIR
jgi:DNA replication protein DnaC